MKNCENYCGTACRNGCCPWVSGTKSQRMKILCENCPYNRGCEDCIYLSNDFCIAYERKINEVIQ